MPARKASKSKGGGSTPILSSIRRYALQDENNDDSPANRSRKDIWKALRCAAPRTSIGKPIRKEDVPNSSYLDFRDVALVDHKRHEDGEAHIHFDQKRIEQDRDRTEPNDAVSKSLSAASSQRVHQRESILDNFGPWSEMETSSTDDLVVFEDSLDEPESNIFDAFETKTKHGTSPSRTQGTAPLSDDETSAVEEDDLCCGSSQTEYKEVNMPTAALNNRVSREGDPWEPFPSMLGKTKSADSWSASFPQTKAESDDIRPACHRPDVYIENMNTFLETEPCEDRQSDHSIAVLLSRFMKLEAMLKAEGVLSLDDNVTGDCVVEPYGPRLTRISDRIDSLISRSERAMMGRRARSDTWLPARNESRTAKDKAWYSPTNVSSDARMPTTTRSSSHESASPGNHELCFPTPHLKSGLSPPDDDLSTLNWSVHPDANAVGCFKSDMEYADYENPSTDGSSIGGEDVKDQGSGRDEGNLGSTGDLDTWAKRRAGAWSPVP